MLALVFIAIVLKEYLDEKRKDKALKYYDEISTTVILADTLGMNLECGDNKGNTWVINGNNKSLLNIVNQHITDYISGEKQSLYSYKIIEDEIESFLGNDTLFCVIATVFCTENFCFRNCER